MELCSSCWKEEGLRRKILYLVFFLLPLVYQQSKNFVSIYKDHQSWIPHYDNVDPLIQKIGSEEWCASKKNTNGTNHPYDSLPKWVRTYVQWHSQQLQSIHANQNSVMDPWRHHKVLLVRCIDDDRCGGTSDRLKSFPMFLILAARTKRLLFLRWNRPFALEEFLIPNDHHHQCEYDQNRYEYFWNWTVPNSLAAILDTGLTEDGPYNQTTLLSTKRQELVSAAQNPNIWLVQGNLQFSGVGLFKTLTKEFLKQEEQDSEENVEVAPTDFTKLYRHFFHAAFAPAPAIRNIVDDLFQRLHLEANRFVVVHIRAKYPGEVFRETHNLTALEEIVDNAICIASNDLVPNTTSDSEGMPIYLASDAMPVLQFGMKHPNVVSRLSSPQQNGEVHDPPHLNFAQKDDPSAFYSIFVDLIVMSQCRCVTFGAGGFGRFGSLVSYDAECRKPHTVKQKMQPCGG